MQVPGLHLALAIVLAGLLSITASVAPAAAVSCNIGDAKRIMNMADGLQRPLQACETAAKALDAGNGTLATACRKCRAAQSAWRRFSRFSKDFIRACEKHGKSAETEELRRLMRQFDSGVAPLSAVLKQACA